MDLLSILQAIGAPKLRQDARRYWSSSREEGRSSQFVRAGHCKGAVFSPGIDLSGQPIRIPAQSFRGHGIVCGASGAGKTMAATSLAQTWLEHPTTEIGSFALIDAKGDTYDRIRRLPGFSRHRDRAICLDFASEAPVPYALLKARPGESTERLVERRMEVFDDVLGRDSQLSLRMSRMLRCVLLLAAEHNLAFPTLEVLFAQPDATSQLAAHSRHERVRAYFGSDFTREKQTTLPALSARLDFLLRHNTLRLSLGADAFPDFRAAMDESVPVLVNTGGPSMSRHATRVIQSLLLSDIRQAIFGRTGNPRPYTWFLDEAQCLFSQPSDVENLTTILSMGRSFGGFIVLITQSLTASTPTSDFMASVGTNVRWITLFRSGPQDARILEAGIEVTGRMVRRRLERGRVAYMTLEQERQFHLAEVANLPNRHAFFWLRGVMPNAVRMTTHEVRTEARPVQPKPNVSAEAIRQKLAREEAQLGRAAFKPVKKTGKADIANILTRLERALEPGEANDTP